jgi:hypothetical protein
MVRATATVSSPPFRVPAAPVEGFGRASVPFQFVGFIEGASSDGTAIRVDLIGRGIMDAAFTRDDDRTVTWFASVFEFSDPAPVPEPASLVLLSIGVGIVTLRKFGRERWPR